ncbi:HlyC/CorC family transporter [bacterium]|nr:MAG: HlyC/CorC family transporter [bacterium]
MFGIFAAFLIIALNGFFVAAEFALVKVRATQLQPRARRGERSAIAAQEILGQLNRYLSVTQVGITFASLALGWVGEPAIEHAVLQAVATVHPGEPGPTLRIVIIGVSFTILTFGHLLLGELVPKLVAIQRSEGTTLFSALPLKVTNFVFYPLLYVVDAASGVLLRLMGLSPDATSEGALSEEEILGILAANTASGPKGKEKSRLVERVLRFSQRTARHAMVPRVDVVSLPVDTTPEAARAVIKAQQFSRVVLTKGRSLDEVVGYLYVKDLLFSTDADRSTSIAKMRRDILFVAETQGLVETLREMQKEHTPIAVVVDEYGGTSGIVTMEDLLEEIVGEIRDEFDEEPARIVKVQSEINTWDVDGRATMEELKPLGVLIEEDDAAELLGAVVLEKLGRLPKVGDTVDVAPGTTAMIFAMHRRRVARVRVRVDESSAGAGDREEEALS